MSVLVLSGTSRIDAINKRSCSNSLAIGVVGKVIIQSQRKVVGLIVTEILVGASHVVLRYIQTGWVLTKCENQQLRIRNT